MSPEASEDLRSLVEELRRANDCSEFGLYEVVTAANFPLIAQNPERLLLVRLRAVKTYVNHLSTARYLVRENDERSKTFSHRIDTLIQDETDTIRSLYPEEIPQDVQKELFFLNNGDAMTIEAAVSNGFVDQLTIRNIPALAALSPVEFAMLRVTALMSAHAKWTAIAEFARRGRTGLQSGEDYLRSTTALAEDMCTQIRSEMESLSSSVLENSVKSE